MINDDSSLVSQAASGVAQAHMGRANADIQAGVAAGNISRDIINTSNTAYKTIAQHEYNNNVNTTNSIIGLSSVAYNTYRERMSKAINYDEANKAKSQYDNVMDGVSIQLKKSKISNMFQERANVQIAKQRDNANITFNKYTGKISAQNQYGSFLQNVHEYKRTIPTGISILKNAENPNNKYSAISDLMNTAHNLAQNPYLTKNNRSKINRILNNIRSTPSDIDNSSLTTDADDHNDISAGIDSTYKSSQQYLHNVLFNGASLIQGVNFDMETDKYKQLLSQHKDVQESFKYLSISKNLPNVLERWIKIGGLKGRIAAIYHKQIKANNGSMVLNGLSPTLRQYKQDWQKAEELPESDTKSAAVSNAWDKYNSYRVIVAINKGFPLSKITSLTPDLVNKMKGVATGKWDQSSTSNIMDSLNNFNKMNGDSPIYGKGVYSDMAQQYHFGGQGDTKHFGSFITSLLPERQAAVAKEYAMSGLSTKDNNDYLKTSILGDNFAKFKSISNLTGIPVPIIQQQFKTYAQQLYMEGESESDVDDNVSSTISGTLSNPNFNVGNNYYVNKDFFAKHNIDTDDRNGAALSIIHTSLVSFAKIAAEHNKDKSSNLVASSIINTTDYLGSADDYHLITTTGSQAFAINNTNDLRIPIADSAIKVAKDHYKSTKKFNIERNYTKFGGIWL